jgi:uncharacterized protein YjhX (UPF0386 family)
MFQKATKKSSKLRMTIDGPAGGGKTYTALRFAHVLAQGGKIAFIDTERGSASKYVGETPDGIPWDFDVLELQQFSPERYTEAIVSAGRMGYSVLVIDSLSHAWEGSGGALDMKQKAGESWSAWRHITPIHNRMVDAILQSQCHIITTMRSRMEYVQETDARGKVQIRKVGLSPIQRPGMEYEFDLVCDIDYSHILTVSKSRCSAVADLIVEKPGAEFIYPVIEWLNDGSKIHPEPEFKPAQFVQPSQPEPVSAEITLDMLVETYGAEQIMVANEGKIPGSQDEINAVAMKLAGVQA